MLCLSHRITYTYIATKWLVLYTRHSNPVIGCFLQFNATQVLLHKNLWCMFFYGHEVSWILFRFVITIKMIVLFTEDCFHCNHNRKKSSNHRVVVNKLVSFAITTVVIPRFVNLCRTKLSLSLESLCYRTIFSRIVLVREFHTYRLVSA